MLIELTVGSRIARHYSHTARALDFTQEEDNEEQKESREGARSAVGMFLRRCPSKELATALEYGQGVLSLCLAAGVAAPAQTPPPATLVFSMSQACGSHVGK